MSYYKLAGMASAPCPSTWTKTHLSADKAAQGVHLVVTLVLAGGGVDVGDLNLQGQAKRCETPWRSQPQAANLTYLN